VGVDISSEKDFIPVLGVNRSEMNPASSLEERHGVVATTSLTWGVDGLTTTVLVPAPNIVYGSESQEHKARVRMRLCGVMALYDMI
jgi:hypothetical protein